LKREIAIDGKKYQVEIAECPIGEPFTLKVNNRPREVTLEQEPQNTKSFLIKVDRKSYQVEPSVLERNSTSSIKVNNIPFKVKLTSTAPKIGVAIPSPVLAPVQKTAAKTQGEGVVVAPMAGKIISVKVTKGDSIKAGSVLCVLEAMKMENEITSTKSGVIEEVRVQEGKAVNEGDILMLIK